MLNTVNGEKGSLTHVSDEPTKAQAADAAAEPLETGAAARPTDNGGPVFSGYGIASAALGLVSAAAIALAAVLWSAHRDHSESLSYQIRVAQAAVDWTGVLINMNQDNVDTSLQKLHDGTVGELNTDFDHVLQPYRDVVQTLQTRTSGQINSVSLETVHHNPDTPPGTRPPADSPPPVFASRTDTVLIVATSVSENSGGKPQTVRWNLRVGVSDVDGKLLISGLEPIR
jgi:hypothetical protein